MGLKITHLMMFDCGESLSHSDRVKDKKQYWRKLLSLFLYPHTISSQLSDVAGLHSLMPNSLSALAGSLKHLVLSNNKLQSVPTYALRQLRELDHINLNQNNISIIKEGAFWGLSKVSKRSLTLLSSLSLSVSPSDQYFLPRSPG